MNADTATDTRQEPAAPPLYQHNPGDALQKWLATDEGERRWAAAGLEISAERVCHVLGKSQATRFGLLLAPSGVIIWSRFSPRSFSRLTQRYEEAAEEGICFWWDGHDLCLVEGVLFFTLIRTLPASTCPNLRTARSRSRQPLRCL
jgi:hypothetical protein